MMTEQNTNQYPPATRTLGGVEYYNMSDAAAAIGYSIVGFRRLLRRLEAEFRQGEITEAELLPIYDLGAGREKFIKKEDLIRYFQPKRVFLSDTED